MTPSSRRLRGGLIVLGVALLLLCGRLFWLQGFAASSYAAQAQNQRLRQVALGATRGEILDSSGAVLAEDVDARGVYINRNQVKDPAAEITALAPIVGMTQAALQARFNLTGSFIWVVHGLTPAQGDAVTKLDLLGVYVQDETRRIYPDGAVGADVVGFTNSADQGVAGIEYADQTLLQGTAGSDTYEVDPDGTPLPGGMHKLVPAVPGTDVELTINRDIQWYAQQVIAEQVAATHARDGSVIVLDPSTGQVLADATAPSFSSSDPGAADPANTGNRTVSSMYEPGSVNKVIIAAAALQTHALSPDSLLDIPSDLVIGGDVFRDAEYHPDEKLTFTGVLAESSNIGAIEIAQRLGNATVAKYLQEFGFGQPTGVGLDGESSGDIPNVNTWGPTTAATIPFGQGMDVTAMQVAAAYGAVANGGVYVAPSLVKGTIGSDGKLVPAKVPATHRVIDASAAATLREMLEQVVTDQGTAPEASIPGYEIAGKTGTADAIGTDGKYAPNQYVASFVGMAPAPSPKLVVEVVLDRPQGDYYGGSAAGPVFQKVMSFALQSLGIAPSNSNAPALPLTD